MAWFKGIVIGVSTMALLSGAAMAQPAKAPAPAAQEGQPKPTEKTIAALQSAYRNAQRAGDFYTRAAKKADEEGILGVGSLMRAAAKVESVHASMFTKQLEALKATTGAAETRPAIVLKTTAENLVEATKTALAARETDLPAERKAAEGESQAGAARSLRDAREGEIELVRLFKDAGELMDQWKKGKRDFYVGRTCGYIVEKLDLTKCPVCGKGKDDFEKVN